MRKYKEFCCGMMLWEDVGSRQGLDFMGGAGSYLLPDRNIPISRDTQRGKTEAHRGKSEVPDSQNERNGFHSLISIKSS